MQVPAQSLELLGQQHRVQRHRHRSGQDLEDPPVGDPEGPLAGPQPHQQLTDLLALMLQGIGSVAVPG